MPQGWLASSFGCEEPEPKQALCEAIQGCRPDLEVAAALHSHLQTEHKHVVGRQRSSRQPGSGSVRSMWRPPRRLAKLFVRIMSAIGTVEPLTARMIVIDTLARARR